MSVIATNITRNSHPASGPLGTIEKNYFYSIYAYLGFLVSDFHDDAADQNEKNIAGAEISKHRHRIRKQTRRDTSLMLGGRADIYPRESGGHVLR